MEHPAPASRSRDLPAADELHAGLARDVPGESAARIVHGDYRLDNVLIDDRDRAAAVIDWEMATLGDPLTDLALLLVYRRLGVLDTDGVVAEASSAPGSLTDDEIVARYTAGTGAPLPRLGFYLALGAFKLASVVEGIHHRYVRGQTVGAGFENVGDPTEPMLELGLTYLTES